MAAHNGRGGYAKLKAPLQTERRLPEQIINRDFFMGALEKNATIIKA